MSLLTVASLLIINVHSSDLSGEWIFKYQTVGGKIKRRVIIDQCGETATVNSSSDKFMMTIRDDGSVKWMLEIPALERPTVATFKGRVRGSDKMSGVLVMSEYPLNSRAVPWKAKRVKRTRSDDRKAN